MQLDRPITNTPAQSIFRWSWRHGIVLLAILLGFWARVHGALTFPFVHDELRVIQNGVRDMFGVGPDQHLGYGIETILFGVPLRNGYFLAPLWWWLQYAVRILSPNNETLVFRVVPIMCALLGLALFYHVVKKIFQHPVPELLVLILSVVDVYLLVTSRSHYVAAFLFIPVLLMLLALVISRFDRRYLPAAIGIGLALAAHLGKGLALVAVLLTTSVWHAISLDSLRAIRTRIFSMFSLWVVAGIGVVPVAIWWIGAEWFFQNNPIRVHDLGYFGHLWEPLFALTIGWGPHISMYVPGEWYWPLLLYTHADAWPTLTYLAIPTLGGIYLAIRNWKRTSEARTVAQIYSLTSIGILFGSFVSRDEDSPRYHVLYLLGVLIMVGFMLEFLWFRSKESRSKRIGGTAVFFLTGLYTAFMFGWQRWPDEWIFPGTPGALMLLFGSVTGGLYAFGLKVWMRRSAVVALVLGGVVLSLVRGPLQWGKFADEPSLTNPGLHAVEVFYHPVQYYPPDVMQEELNAQFSDGLTLLGYDTELAEDNLILTLHLRTDEPPNEPYHLFVHLWDPVTETVALGFDERSLNRQGLPTNDWLVGEHVSQTIVLDLSSIPAGSYTLGTGLYDYATNERLSILDQSGIQVPNNWLLLIEEFKIPAVKP